MKWVSCLASLGLVAGVLMVNEGRIANSMKAEIREALILYGILIVAVCLIWLLIHGITALVRRAKESSTVSS